MVMVAGAGVEVGFLGKELSRKEGINKNGISEGKGGRDGIGWDIEVEGRGGEWGGRGEEKGRGRWRDNLDMNIKLIMYGLMLGFCYVLCHHTSKKPLYSSPYLYCLVIMLAT